MNVEVVQRRLQELSQHWEHLQCKGLRRRATEGGRIPVIKAVWKAGCLESLHVRFGVGAQVRLLGPHHSSSAAQPLDAELDALLEPVDPEDLEQQMERLRQFAQGNMLRVAAADPADVMWYDASTQLRVEMLDDLAVGPFWVQVPH